MTATAEKLDSELSAALDELRRTKETKQEAAAAQQQALETRLSASARLVRLEKVRKKVRSKEYRLVKQGLRELKADKQKKSNSLKAESLGTLVAY